MIPLETQAPITESFGMAFLGTIFLGASLASFHFGWKAYSEPRPHFTTHYSGGSCPSLSLFYNGIFALCMALATLKSILPHKAGGFLGLIALPCALIFILGYFIWFPRVLLPRWYPRAVKAGVPRHDPLLMGAFKALPRTEQLELLHHTTTSAATPALPSQAPTTPTTTKTPRYHTPTPTTGHGNLPLGITSGLNQQPSSPNKNQDPR